MQLEELISAFLLKAKNAGCENLFVGYSGGVDSHVLLILIHQINQRSTNIPLKAVHINHNIQQNSKKWSNHCRSVCDSFGIELLIMDVQAKAVKGENQEQKARDCRYQAFQSLLKRQDYLLTAQHKNDQAETILLHLLRASGVDGLSAMQSSRALGCGTLHRPLLDVSREDIMNYAIQNNLKWIEDPSNSDESIRRNFLRNSIIPKIQQKWPDAVDSLAATSELMNQHKSLISELAIDDFKNCNEGKYKVSLNLLKGLSKPRQYNLMRHWYALFGLKSPGTKRLLIIENEIINASDDAKPLFQWQGYELRRFNNFLYLVSTIDEIKYEIDVDLDSQTNIQLPPPLGLVKVEKTHNRGLSQSNNFQKLEVRTRQGGEKCQPSDRSKRRSLKKLFVEYEIPPWLRDCWPILYADGKIIAVIGLFVCKGYEALQYEPGIGFELSETIFDLR